MSFNLSITGTSSTLTTNHSPALQLDGEYECGLLYLSTFNSIPNIDYRNNKFYYGKNDVLEIPEGSYELQDLDDYIKSHIQGCAFKLTCNNNTLKTSICCTKNVYFNKEHSIGKLLGFGNETVKANILRESPFPVSILTTPIVRVEWDIVSGSFVNGKPSHIIHEFVPNVPPGYRIIETPENVIYFPVTQNNIDSLKIRILDINDTLVNLRGEEIQIYLHLRKKYRLQ
jgi:hypothetical protein